VITITVRSGTPRRRTTVEMVWRGVQAAVAYAGLAQEPLPVVVPEADT
jgi:hypothetical protein